VTKSWIDGIDWARKPLFLAIAEAIERALESGSLKKGESLPPHRECARQLGVALGTVTRAYAEAERNGLIVGNRRGGTRIAARREEGADFGSFGRRREDLIDLGINYPGPAEDPDPAAALQAIARRLDRRALLRYPPTSGSLPHRKAYAAFLGTMGIEVAPDGVLLCSGAQHGIDVLLQALFKPGDHVAVEELCYPGFLGSARHYGLRLHAVGLDDEGLLPEELDALCGRTRISALYCVPSFQNPTGALMSEERKRSIAEIARRRDLVIIEDEIYRPLAGSSAPPAFVALAPERTCLVSSLSKAVCGGLRVGGIVAPQAFMERLEKRILSSIWAAAPLGFEILLHWMEDGTIRDTVARRRASNAARQVLAARILGNITGLRLRAGRGNLFAWMSLPEGVRRGRVLAEALERGIALAPSELFVLDGADPPEALRLSISTTADIEDLELALSRLAAIIDGLSRGSPRSSPRVGGGIDYAP